ncbi:hypothetical protein CG709_19635, partial [Lachnotalea glycerini]
MKKKKIYLILIFLISLTACSNKASNQINERKSQDVSEAVQEEREPYQIPESYNKVGENITFQTEIIFNQKILETGLYYTTGTLQKIDYDKAFEILFKDKETASKEEHNIDGDNFVSYQSSNYEDLSISSDSLIYLTPEHIYYSHSFSEYDDDYNANLYSTDLDFDFASKEEIWTKMINTMNEIGYD